MSGVQNAGSIGHYADTMSDSMDKTKKTDSSFDKEIVREKAIDADSPNIEIVKSGYNKTTPIFNRDKNRLKSLNSTAVEMHVDQALADAPPLTEEQVGRIARLLTAKAVA